MNEMNRGYAPRLDGFPMQCLKKGGMAVLEMLLRLLNGNFYMEVPLYKWKGEAYE